MVISFFYDSVLPKKTEKKTKKGKFNYYALIPFIVAPLIIIKIWIWPSDHQILETLALASWYIGCLILPLTTEDDDMGLMFWLYHLVLLMIPIACDLVWWTAGITPSNWWPVQGSTVPISLLLMKETVLFDQEFNYILMWLVPGILLFLGLIYAKRSEFGPVKNLSERLRGF